MPIITLPNGDQKQFDQAVSVMDVALSIGPGLAKNTVAGRVNDRLVDASDLITEDATIQIITPKDEEGVEIIRHSCAHLVGHAVKQLFPEAKMVIGPVIEEGFYYDIWMPRPFTLDDMAAIEERMKKLIDQDYDVVKKMTPRDEVIAEFTARGEEYKLRLIADMPEETQMGLYYHQDYLDMCRGPHVPNTKFLKSFKLTKISGAYWRGDAKNEQLQRIYGTAWADKKQLAAYVKRIEEAEKRDHRKIGKALDLFHMQEEAPGMVFWHPNGWTIYQVLEQYMRKVQEDNGYQEIRTPQVVDFTLWEKSGHAANYADNMFTTHSENRNYAVKPMNCPCHVQVFNQGLKSYRDLPIRLAEFGSCHRNEPSGSLHGIMRVRGFTQDDAHIFCTTEQIGPEVADFIKLTLDVYKDFGFEEVQMKLSTRPEKRVGDDKRRGREVVHLDVRADAAFEVTVAGQHGGDGQIVGVDGLGDFRQQRAGVADAGGAAEADQLVAERVEIILQAGGLQIVGHALRAGGQRGLDPGLGLKALGMCVAGDQAGGDHHGRVGGVGA